MEHIDFNNIVGSSQQSEQVLGKFLYFSLSSILVDKEAMAELCQTIDIAYAGGSRESVSDAFRSSTGELKERIVTAGQVYQVYCRDNKRTTDAFSRELVKEAVGVKTNSYSKLANLYFDKTGNQFGYDNLVYDEAVDAGALCAKAAARFELHLHSANRKQLETICQSFIRSVEAIKMSGNGYLYFVPRQFMHKVDAFETFIEAVSEAGQCGTPLSVNSFYIVNDDKQRNKMTQEFYSAVKKEIAEYQERAAYFIDTDSRSPIVLERWALRIVALEEKKRHYEDILRRELTDLDDEFSSLRILGEELSLRARSLRFRSVA